MLVYIDADKTKSEKYYATPGEPFYNIDSKLIIKPDRKMIDSFIVTMIKKLSKDSYKQRYRKYGKRVLFKLN